ncbi:uncharacterized protein CcaverHIS019_0500530 [Cutaneotrichosporon cavernicola]|uniref:Uncharacterized protein n=1 Tax=Cutaneotrichosporon cavernicola TaxID=279322 RepID=A0AA48L5R0_9TREE|nr:uncharacterized protein CcaverHIS019_0500530 [Cutaneotrichosporon cavernicola]BEI92425.1 hypothetical protein CcaverHIS019_0500530 [Cutaneotrichosporon cavernicola]BEJ00198.1 hypothetical protein CcaverHIS631_0500550 [Cutaneotrichosporon cavernicola]BEJ07969.1 hypothetical protein CcaverHIS641_0500540 [Cutaneotrichosporon cavernicola]
MATIQQPNNIMFEQVSITLNSETIVQKAEVTDEVAADLTILDDECYDCLNCDYESFDQWSERLSVPGTPMLSHSPAATPAEQPSTPLFAPTNPSLKSEHLSLGERLISACSYGLQALGTTALHAILPSDEDDHHLVLSPRLSPTDKTKSDAHNSSPSPSPVILLEPARPGAHVRFLVRPPRPNKTLPLSSIAAFGSSMFSVEEEESSDEEFEMFEEGAETI